MEAIVRSLIIAAVTFLGLGAYYHASHPDAASSISVAQRKQLSKVARSAALFGVSRLRKALVDDWVDQRVAGRHGGGNYRCVAVLKRGRGVIRAVGIAQSEKDHLVTRRVRVSVTQVPVGESGGAGTYRVTVGSPQDEE